VYRFLCPGAGTTQTRTFVYSDAGLLTSATNPENGTVSYYYNADNTLHTSRMQQGSRPCTVTTAAKRALMAKRYPPGAVKRRGRVPARDLQLDYAWNGYQQNLTGRLSYTQWGSSTTACVPNVPATSYAEYYSYSQAGAPQGKQLQVTRSGTTSTLAASYTFNYAGGIASSTYPSWNPSSPIQPVFNYAFDTSFRPLSLTESDNSVGMGAECPVRFWPIA